MHLGPLEQVLGRDRVELRARPARVPATRLFAHDLLRADGGADAEVVGEHVLERRRLGGRRVARQSTSPMTNASR